MGRLDNKVAIVTGGASGIGEGTVIRFVEEGGSVVIADVQDDKGAELASRLGDKVLYQHTDVSIEAQVSGVVDLAVSQFGHLDCMFNNAGFGGTSGPLLETETDEFYQQTLGVMFTGVLYGMKHAARVMIPRGSGSIVCTASVAGVKGGFGPHVYSGIKSAVIGMTRSVALELSEHSIRVNAICPGGIATHIFAGAVDPDTGSNENTPDLIRPVLAQLHPIPRSGEPVDIANMALFLASDESTFVTGQALVVDGGLTAMHRGLGKLLPDEESQ